MSESSDNAASNVLLFNSGLRKKRLACDACHSSKVRCTGEVTGCQRCQRSDRFCHYSESNMGRHPADVQRRRNPSSPWPSISTSSTESHREIDQIDWNPASPLNSRTDSSNPSSNSSEGFEFDQVATENMGLWRESRSLHPYELGVDEMELRDVNSTLIHDDSLLDADFLQFPASPLPGLSTQQQRQTHVPSHNSSSTSTSSRLPETVLPLSSVQTWSLFLEQISCPPGPSPVPLDKLLQITSTLLPRATDALRSLPTDGYFLAPLILVLLCLTQAIALLEQCLPAVFGGFPVASGSRDIALRLGTFQVSREVQVALQRHIVSKELGRVLQVAHLGEQVIKAAGSSAAEKRAHTVLVEDLVRRTKALRAMAAEKGNAGIVTGGHGP